MSRASLRSVGGLLPGAKPAPSPAFIPPRLAALRTKIPTASGFVHELKLDRTVQRTCVMPLFDPVE
jgi:hypothetical protein